VTLWAGAAIALLLGLVPCGIVIVARPHADAVVAFQLAGTLVVLDLVLLAEAFDRPSYYAVPLVLAPLSIIGGMLFARFLHVRR
jgi:multisubunit Na+/H+ antiporter MnhF subunit